MSDKIVSELKAVFEKEDAAEIVEETIFPKHKWQDLEYPLVNGTTIRFLKDKDIYLGNQVEKTDSDRCYGVVADEGFILVCEYGCNGAEPEIVLYKRR